MLWLSEIREAEIRRITLFLLIPTFIYLNWGHSLSALEHIFLSMRAASNHRLAIELSDDISESVLDLGKTGASLFVIFFIWVIFGQLLKWANYDSKLANKDIKKLTDESIFLISKMQENNIAISMLLTGLDALTCKTPDLVKHNEKISELTVKLGALYKKSKSKVPQQQPGANTEEPNLFDTYQQTKKRPPRKRKKRTPKF